MTVKKTTPRHSGLRAPPLTKRQKKKRERERRRMKCVRVHANDGGEKKEVTLQEDAVVQPRCAAH